MGKVAGVVLAVVVLCRFAAVQDAPESDFRALQVDAGKVLGEIRSFQGLNGQPTPAMEGLPNLVEQYKDLRLNQVRTHDFMGPTEIDSKFEFKNGHLTWLIPNDKQRAEVVKNGNASIIFPDPSADPDKPGSYNFGPTDKVLAAIRASGAEIYFRIGRSWGANTNPPANFDKYAAVVKHIAMHYNQGWANGFHYNIRYWEFWNEPEGFWSGTPEQFYWLYEKTARALKAVDPNLKVGGDARAMPFDDGPWREGFVDYCKSHQLPLDFYSWHTYAIGSADPYDAVRLAKSIRDVLNAHGFAKAESVLSEWNLTPDFTDKAKLELQGMHNAAFVGAVLAYLQDAGINQAHFYRGDAAWMGLFDLQGKYFKTAYVFKAMGKMLDTPQRLLVQGTDTFGFAALAGRSANGKTVQIFISNYAIPASWKPETMEMPAELKEPDQPDWNKYKLLPTRKDIVYRNNGGYQLSITHLPWRQKEFTLQRYRLSQTQDLALVDEKSVKGDTLKLSNSLPPDSVELIVLQQK